MKQIINNHKSVLEKGTMLVSFGLLLASCLMTLGCGPRYPDNFPKIYPCSITITQEGKPAADVMVSLHDQSGSWAISGKTDANGVAQMKTHGQYLGAPAGEFVVVLDKSETQDDSVVTPTGGGAAGTVRVFSYVDPQYIKQETSPLKITVAEDTTNETFEIGSSERKLIMEIKPGGL